MLFILSFLWQSADLFLDAWFGLRDWLKLNDFSGSRRRKRYLAEAPGSFKLDGLPVVLGASDDTTLLYNDNGFILQNRHTRNTVQISQKDLRRFVRRGMKGLRSTSLRLSRK